MHACDGGREFEFLLCSGGIALHPVYLQPPPRPLTLLKRCDYYYKNIYEKQNCGPSALVHSRVG